MNENYLGGLSCCEVEERISLGKINVPTRKCGKSIGDIFKDNFLTYFNFLNLCLALAVIAVGSYANCSFLLLALCNAAIGTIQEIRAKKSIEKLTLVTTPKVTVVREAKQSVININEIVIDDVMVLSAGAQIPADCLILDGSLEVNEALLTGEPDQLLKKSGDTLLSGSDVVSGECYARVLHVGDDNYCETIAFEAKKHKKPSSEILNSINSLIKSVSVLIVPIGIILFCKQFFILDDTITNSVTSSVAAMVGMIPAGLVLLTSMVFAASVIRFSKRDTLVQEMYGIEQLAMADVLCLDKTGTITEGSMRVEDTLPINCDYEQAKGYIELLLGVLNDNNPTFIALKDYYTANNTAFAKTIVPFSSDRKWSGAFINGKSYIIGAEEYVLKGEHSDICKIIRKYADKGMRVLVVAFSEYEIVNRELPNGLEPFALIILSDIIKDDAAQTISFFTENGVDVKIISGDSAYTVYGIAKRAGITNCEEYIDVNEVSDEELEKIALEYNIFGRVLPKQKQIIIRSLKNAGHKVAMVGDGVNDVLALREADCSIAMESGSSAAGSASKFILLDNKLSSLLAIVMEGRRSINNLQRSASLFLNKTIYSFLLSTIFMLLPLSYPFKPIQLTLISTILVGIPSFILAMEPNKRKITGNFMRNVISTAIPSALTIVVHVLISSVYGAILGYNTAELSTIATLLAAFVCLTMLIDICRPFDSMRAVMLAVLTAAFICVAYFGDSLFMMSKVTISMLIYIAGGITYGVPLYLLLKKIAGKIYDVFNGFLVRSTGKKGRKQGR